MADARDFRRPLPVAQLRRRCVPHCLTFTSTAELEPLPGTLGQERAVEALQFGASVRHHGYNLFVMGSLETGKQTVVRNFLQDRAAGESTPSDIVYVNNFQEAHRPRAIELPAGRGARLRRDVGELVQDLSTAIPAAFEGEGYRVRKQAIERELKSKEEQAFDELRRDAESRGLAFLRTPMGFSFAPMRDGEVLASEAVEKLPPERQDQLREDVRRMHDRLRSLMEQIPLWEKDARERVRQVARDVTTATVVGLVKPLREAYADAPSVVEYLTQLQEDVIDNAEDFLKPPDQRQAAVLGSMDDGGLTIPAGLRRYEVNLFLDRTGLEGAPVVHEDHPTYQNLLGRIEHLSVMGTLVTDFGLVKSGSLHRALGGYLIVDVHKLLMQPYAWEGLKRALTSREIRIESLAQSLSLVSTVSLEPEPVPMDLKVVLIGDRQLYYLLDAYDPEFRNLFKVAVDFEEDLDRDTVSDMEYARLVAAIVKREGIRHFDRDAVAAVIEHSGRLAEHAGKMSAHMDTVADLLREADHWACEAGHEMVGADDVRRALRAQDVRTGRIRERLVEQITEDVIHIAVEGSAVAQINGLSVVELGNTRFGHPTRISATVRLGRGEVVNIEREVKLSGPFHSKGVLILSGFLGERYAPGHPLSLAANLVFEQSYAYVDGDSASAAELFSLLSALSELPLRQDLAVTGAIDQRGRVQAIGGVNEKIEGFFAVCRRKGLTGKQGVVIPASNVRHLMLRDEVLEAVEQGQFAVYAIGTVDEGLELLTGVAAGERDHDGAYPAESVNGRVEARLLALARRREELAAAQVARAD